MLTVYWSEEWVGVCADAWFAYLYVTLWWTGDPFRVYLWGMTCDGQDKLRHWKLRLKMNPSWFRKQMKNIWVFRLIKLIYTAAQDMVGTLSNLKCTTMYTENDWNWYLHLLNKLFVLWFSKNCQNKYLNFWTFVFLKGHIYYNMCEQVRVTQVIITYMIY